MGSEITAGLPASLTAIGIYSGIISAVGIACCSFVSVWEKRLRLEERRASSPPRIEVPSSASLKPVETSSLRNDFLSRN
jgi:hypothetical protein